MESADFVKVLQIAISLFQEDLHVQFNGLVRCPGSTGICVGYDLGTEVRDQSSEGYDCPVLGTHGLVCGCPETWPADAVEPDGLGSALKTLELLPRLKDCSEIL